MKALSLFSGIGGIDLACEWAGIETVAFCEREPFPQKVLRKHWPDVPIYDDVCTLTKERLDADGIGTIDLIHGGYPCQPFSTAGKREGENDDRHLWPEVFRLIQALKPRWFVGENVAGHITLGLDIVLADLDSIDYAWETFVLPASAVYALHRRDRTFVVAYPKSLDSWGLSIREKAKLAGLIRSSKDVADTESERRREAREYKSERTTQRTAGSGEAATNPASEGLQIGRQSGWAPSQAETGTRLESQPERCGTPFGREQWSVEPDVGRVANGVSDRAHRLKALGNAVVPQQIYPIIAAIKAIDDLARSAIDSTEPPRPTQV